MIEVKEHAAHGVLALRVSGTLSEEELDDVVPSLKQHISSSDDPDLLMIMEDFNGWEDAAAVWKDLRLDAEYIGYFDRIGIVGEKKWQKWGTQLLNPLTRQEMKFFPVDQAEDAWKWIRQNHN